MAAMENVLKRTEEVQKQMTMLKSELIETQEAERKKIKKDSEVMDVMTVLHSLDGALTKLLDRQERFFKEERDHWLAERGEWQKRESELRREISQLNEKLSNRIPSPSATDKSSSEEKMSSVDAAKEPMDAAGDIAEKVKDSIGMAFAAVNLGDVLSEDYEKLLRPSSNGRTVPANSPSTDKETDIPVETVKSPPTGPPPTLAVGDDDIYWVSQLQTALGKKGYYCGDDDVEDFYFGEGTVSALLTFQACSGLKETGTADAVTWKALLGEDLKPVVGDVQPEGTTLTTTDLNTSPTPTPTGNNVEPKEFPVLSECDGGKEVHRLQVMLEVAGFSCGKDDMMWWHYGDDTIAAIKTFQACNGLPQSGVADTLTWEKLAGEGKSMQDICRIVEKEQMYEEDLTKSDRVWLIGEQRWERKL